MQLQLLPAVVLFGLASLIRAVAADDPADTIKALQQRIEQLDQKVRILERKNELEQDAAAEKSKAAPRISIDAGGFSAGSADTHFYPGDETPAKDTFLLRRVRPIVEGTVYGKFDYRLMLDFASGVSSST